MPRILRSLLAVIVIGLTTAVVLAQPGGGGSGTPIPSRPPVFEDLEDVLADPEGAMGELIQMIQRDLVDPFIRENRAAIEDNLDALPAALQANATRLLAIALGILALLFPARAGIWPLLFVGAVLGLIVAQIPAGNDIRQLIFEGDLEFLRDEPLSSIAMVGVGALAGLVLIAPFFYLTLIVGGAFVGIAAGLQVVGFDPDLAAPAMAIGGTVGFIVMSYVLGRGRKLVPIAIGAGLVTFGLGLGYTFAIPLMVASAIFAAARSAQGKQSLKRVALPTLTLAEGRVDMNRDQRKTRAHLHEIVPSMADDRDNPLIKR